MEYQPTHLGITEKYLTVEFWAKTGNSQRRGQVKIPVEWLLNDEVSASLDRAVRRRLIEVWSGQPLQEPLF